MTKKEQQDLDAMALFEAVIKLLPLSVDVEPEPKSLYQLLHERFPMIPIAELAKSWELWLCIERCTHSESYGSYNHSEFIDAVIWEFSCEWDSDLPYWFKRDQQPIEQPSCPKCKISKGMEVLGGYLRCMSCSYEWKVIPQVTVHHSKE